MCWGWRAGERWRASEHMCGETSGAEEGEEEDEELGENGAE